MDGRTDTKTQICMEGMALYSILIFKWRGIIKKTSLTPDWIMRADPRIFVRGGGGSRSV